MLYTIKNQEITVTVSDLGAELMSVKSKESCEYIWQGDPEFWKGHAPLLFPICGRLEEGYYTFEGKQYEMKLHGFARHSVFQAVTVEEELLRFVLSANEECKKIYPFDFELTVEYRLCGRELITNVEIKNTGDRVLPATFGLHPGFNVPLDRGSFEDWRLEFDSPCSPDAFLLSDRCFLLGGKEAFPLEKGTILPLRHSLFDHDAIFLSRMAQTVTLCSDKSERSVRFSFPEFPYLGFWHAPRTEAPYVCIEPWCGMPSYDGIVDDFSKKRDLFRLQPGQTKELHSSILFA